jgi:hypothetical protein
MHRSQLQQRSVEDLAVVARRARKAARRESREAFAAVAGMAVLVAAAMGWRPPS